MVLDIERATRRLMAVGLDEEVATGIADVVAEATGDLATKADLESAIAKLELDIAEFKREALVEIAEFKSEVLVQIAELRADMGQLEGRFFRALWIMGAGLLLANAALLSAVTGIILALG